MIEPTGPTSERMNPRQIGNIMARTSPAQFVREVRQELSKVTWPTRKELVVTTASVFAMAIAAALFFFLVDQIIAWVVQLILGIGS
jgi:preprotein translocase subunit SecE